MYKMGWIEIVVVLFWYFCLWVGKVTENLETKIGW